MASILKVDQIQLPDGSAPTAADLGIDVSGSVVQVVQGTGSYSWTTSTSYVDTGLSVTITPTSATSKILILVHHGGAGISDPSGVGDRMYARILRDTTEIKVMGQLFGYTYTTMRLVTDQAASHLDSPNTTSAVTYKTQIHAQGGEQVSVGYGSVDTTITAIEIAQ